MSVFKRWINGLTVANRTLNYMDVKELSELVESDKAAARAACAQYLRRRRTYDTACRAYLAQCQNNRMQSQKMRGA